MIESLTIRIPQTKLLSAIWFSDGSGARFDIGFEGLSYSDYRIESIGLEGPDCVLSLVRIQEERHDR